jgi:hypothetical protein
MDAREAGSVDELVTVLGEAITAADGPRLIQVAVAPGMAPL